RTFSVAGPVTLRPRASALALPGPGLDALLGRVTPPGPGLLQVTAAGSPAAQARGAGVGAGERGRGAARVPGQPDQRIGKRAVDRGERQPGHPPELAGPAAHRFADRAARPRPAVHPAARPDH